MGPQAYPLAQSTQDAGKEAQHHASKWDLLMWMGVSTLHASNIKGKTFQFAHVWRPASCVDWAFGVASGYLSGSRRVTGVLYERGKQGRWVADARGMFCFLQNNLGFETKLLWDQNRDLVSWIFLTHASEQLQVLVGWGEVKAAGTENTHRVGRSNHIS